MAKKDKINYGWNEAIRKIGEINKGNDTSKIDWNLKSLDEIVNYLENKFKESNTDDAICINTLIEFYKEKTKIPVSNKPLPCPFCGEEVIEVLRPGTNKVSRQVMCSECGCELETNEIDSWEQWNRRV